LKITCKHKSINQLLGLVHWLESEIKKLKKTQPRHCRYRQCPGASNAFTKTCKHKSIKKLLGLTLWLESKEKKSKKYQPRHCRYQQCLGALDSFRRTCKHKSINQLQGLIQCLESEKKNFKNNLPYTVGTGSALGLQIHSRKLPNTSPSISYWV
jgi:hypothetical protein